VTARGLHLRRALPGLFGEGVYLPLGVSGAQARHVIAFARHDGRTWVLAIAPRLPVGLSAVGVPPVGRHVWSDTAIRLPDGAPHEFRNALTGEHLAVSDGSIALADALATLPLALVVSADAVDEGPRPR
jgi:(1->4)-alpha-D-glucan 1-alpha-D-glucosylmutase